jgi:hypothetical protein
MPKYFQKLGLTWRPIKLQKRNIGAYRMDLLREFLISLDNLYKNWSDDPENSENVSVFTDESYIHQNHSCSNSYLIEGMVANKKSSKGQRLIILHAKTPFVPVCERVDGVPIDDIMWKGDTPHSTPLLDGLKTAKL